MWHSQVSVPSSRSPSRFGAHTVVEGAEANVPEGGFCVFLVATGRG